jgi:hypothetical protein
MGAGSRGLFEPQLAPHAWLVAFDDAFTMPSSVARLRSIVARMRYVKGRVLR